VLLNKLVEISAGKWSVIKKDKESGLLGAGPRSLNVGYRKKETERIERENHAFAKRLFDKQANMSKKQHDHDFKSHLKYKN
jgi:S-adenosylmethionine synthetase